MGLHDPFEYFKHKLWPKTGLGIKLPIWLPTIKSRESPRFTPMQVACHIPLEITWRRLQLCFELHLNRRSSQKNMGLQSCGGPNFGDFKTPNLGVLGQNDIWVLAPWLGPKITMRGKVVASFKFGPWWALWICVCPWLVHAPKVLQLCINQLVVWFMQIPINNWPTCHSS
jgi:hypothetical protein